VVIGIVSVGSPGVDREDAVEARPPGGVDHADPDTAVPTGPPRPGLLQLLMAFGMVCSVAALFIGVFAFSLSGFQEQRSQHLLYADFRGLLDSRNPVAPSIGGVIHPGTPIAMLSAPVAGLDRVIVVEGSTSGDVLSGPGHRPNTPLPGQPGASIIVGRSVTSGAPFAGIALLRRGSVIHVRTGQGPFRYTVVGRVPDGQPLPTVRSDSGLLILVTSTGSGWAGKLTSSHLLYVVARLDGTAVPAPHGRPNSVPVAAVQGHNDPAGWLLLVGLMAVLIGVSALVWRAWYRWGLLRTWLVGAPVLLAILWSLGNAAMRLVPNVY